MFFVRIAEWGWDEAPAPVPMFPGDLPRQDHPLPGALDDATAAKLLRAAQADRRMLVGVTVGDAAAHGAAGQRVHRPPRRRGRAHRCRAVAARPGRQAPPGPLPAAAPQLVTLIDGYRAAHVPAGHPLLLPRENGRPLDRHTVTRFINKAGAAAGLPHIHPHQLRHTLAPRPSTAA